MRLQLTRGVVHAVCWAVAGLWVDVDLANAQANLTSKVALETSGYQDTTATGVLTPTVNASIESPTAGWGIQGRYLVDMVSAASPDIVSTASRRWVEVRHAGNLGARYKPGATGLGVNATASSTPDYLSLGGSAAVTHDLDEKNLTLVASYGFGYDQIGKTGTPLSVFSRDFIYHLASVALSKVLSPAALFTLVVDAQIERGDQSKPYRFIPLFSKVNAAKIGSGASPDVVGDLRQPEKPLEQLPLQRERYAVTGKLAYRPGSATLRIDERLYTDTWDMKASTTDLRYMVDLGENVIFWPHLRFHYQTPVSFWRNAYISEGPNDIPALRTGDRELGRLLNAGGGVGLRLALGSKGDSEAWVLTATTDAVYTRFFETLYVRERISLLSVLNLEATF